MVSLVRKATIARGIIMVRRREITDRTWEHIGPLLPQDGGKERGGRWREHRAVVNGIPWKLRTGSPWRDIPYGLWQTCFDRWRRGVSRGRRYHGCSKTFMYLALRQRTRWRSNVPPSRGWTVVVVCGGS
jgi:transposase